MTPEVTKELSDESGELSDFHKALLDHVKKLVRMSRSTMSKSYEDWDNQMQIYKGERQPDKDDREQSKRDKPVKMVVPTTFAQVMTFTSFLFMLYTQNRTFMSFCHRGTRIMAPSMVIARNFWSGMCGKTSGTACCSNIFWTRRGMGWGCWNVAGPGRCPGFMPRRSLR